MSTEIHVVPIDDTFPHRADMTCCDAYIDSGGLVIHHAHDKRECYERVGCIGESGWKLQMEDNGGLIDLPSTESSGGGSGCFCGGKGWVMLVGNGGPNQKSSCPDCGRVPIKPRNKNMTTPNQTVDGLLDNSAETCKRCEYPIRNGKCACELSDWRKFADDCDRAAGEAERLAAQTTCPIEKARWICHADNFANAARRAREILANVRDHRCLPVAGQMQQGGPSNEG